MFRCLDNDGKGYSFKDKKKIGKATVNLSTIKIVSYRGRKENISYTIGSADWSYIYGREFMNIYQN